MLLTLFYHNFLVLILTLLYIIHTNLLIYIKTNNTIYEAFFTLPLSEPLINWPACLWTLPTFTAPFFLVYTLLLYVTYSPHKSSLNTVTPLPLLLLLVLDNVYLGYNLNVILDIGDFSIVYENDLLKNFINKCHPLLLYASFILFFITLFLWYILPYAGEYTIYNYPYISLINTFLTYIIISLITFALFLGSLWSSQEVSWGGWWNWDSSENLGLLIFIGSISLVHKLKITKIPLYTFYYTFLWILLITFSYSVVQLTFESSSHNFDFSVKALANPLFVRLDILVTVVCLGFTFLEHMYIVLLKLTYFYIKYKNLNGLKNLKIFWLKILLTVILCTVLLFSLDLLWELFFSGYDKPTEDLFHSAWESFLVYIYLYFYNTLKTPTFSIILFYYCWFTVPFSLFILKFRSVSFEPYTLIHASILTLVLVNFSIKNFDTFEIRYFNQNFDNSYLCRFYTTVVTQSHCLSLKSFNILFTQIINLDYKFEVEGNLNLKKEFINECVNYLTNHSFIHTTVLYTNENFSTQIFLINHLLYYFIVLLSNIFIYFFVVIFRII